MDGYGIILASVVRIVTFDGAILDAEKGRRVGVFSKLHFMVKKIMDLKGILPLDKVGQVQIVGGGNTKPILCIENEPCGGLHTCCINGKCVLLKPDAHGVCPICGLL